MMIEHIYTENECLIVDTDTGEVLAKYPLTNIKQKEASVTTGFLRLCTNEDQLVSVAKANGNSRRKCYEWLDAFLKEEMWLHSKGGYKKSLTKPALNLLRELIVGVETHNVIIAERQVVSDHLGVKVGHLNRKLECLTKRGLAKVDTKGCSKGYIKIELHPQLVFRGTLEQKELITQQWCQANTEASNKDHLYTPKQRSKWAKSEYVPKYTDYDEYEVESVRNGKLKSSNLAKIMFMTNDEFKNFLSGDITL